MSTRDPEKHPLQGYQMQNIDKPTNANMPNAPWSRLRQIATLALIILVPMLSYRGYHNIKVGRSAGADNLRISSTEQQNPSSSPVFQDLNGPGLVPLEAHIMSKCPDARDCLRDLIVPAMEKISDKVDFRLSFIGTVIGDNDVHCMHGPAECLGNIISLCAISLFPKDAVRSLGFTNCLLRSYSRIPARDLVQSCASEYGIEFDALNACISDDDGTGLHLLQESIERSEEAGIKKSCTIRVRDKIWCIRDGGEWKDCSNGSSVNALVTEILNTPEVKI